LKERKIKAKETTAAVIQEVASEVNDDDIAKAMEIVSGFISSLQTLRGKHQSPMKGGRKPANVADAACVWLMPEGAAAQKETAKEVVFGVL
jgi:hypothetical protein